MLNPTASLTPKDYVAMLQSMVVPDYTGSPDGVVKISKYLSANASFGGNSNAGVLQQAVREVAKVTRDTSLDGKLDDGRVFTGQGSIRAFLAVLSFVNRHKEDFKAQKTPWMLTVDKIAKPLTTYLDEPNFLQALVDAGCLGLDCIGFVGTYLVESRLNDQYERLYPIDYAKNFPLVKRLDTVVDGSVVILTNGTHIQIIDKVTFRGPGFITVNLCQSSSGGPQTNVGVKIHTGGGNYLPIVPFRTAKYQKNLNSHYWVDYLKTLTNKDGKTKPPTDGGYETYLRGQLTIGNQTTGYLDGTIFQSEANGVPSNPVRGAVYIGAASFTMNSYFANFFSLFS